MSESLYSDESSIGKSGFSVSSLEVTKSSVTSSGYGSSIQSMLRSGSQHDTVASQDLSVVYVHFATCKQCSLNVDYALRGCLDMVEVKINPLSFYFSPFFP